METTITLYTFHVCLSSRLTTCWPPGGKRASAIRMTRALVLNRKSFPADLASPIKHMLDWSNNQWWHNEIYIYICIYIHIIMTVIIYICIHTYIYIIKHMGIPPFFQWLPHEMFPIMRILWGYSICNEKTWFDNPPASPKAGWKWGFSDGLNGDLMIIGQPVWWFMVSKEWHLFRKRKLEIMSPVLQVYFCGTDWWMVA